MGKSGKNMKISQQKLLKMNILWEGQQIVAKQKSYNTYWQNPEGSGLGRKIFTK